MKRRQTILLSVIMALFMMTMCSQQSWAGDLLSITKNGKTKKYNKWPSKKDAAGQTVVLLDSYIASVQSGAGDSFFDILGGIFGFSGGTCDRRINIDGYDVTIDLNGHELCLYHWNSLVLNNAHVTLNLEKPGSRVVPGCPIMLGNNSHLTIKGTKEDERNRIAFIGLSGSAIQMNGKNSSITFDNCAVSFSPKSFTEDHIAEIADETNFITAKNTSFNYETPDGRPRPIQFFNLKISNAKGNLSIENSTSNGLLVAKNDYFNNDYSYIKAGNELIRKKERMLYKHEAEVLNPHYAEKGTYYTIQECSGHEFETYTDITDDTHTSVCKWCGLVCTVPHSPANTATYTAENHTFKCACGNTYTKAHEYADAINKSEPTRFYDQFTPGQHLLACTVCDHEYTENCTYPKYPTYGDVYHTLTCSVCNKSTKSRHWLHYSPTIDKSHVLACYDCGHNNGLAEYHNWVLHTTKTSTEQQHYIECSYCHDWYNEVHDFSVVRDNNDGTHSRYCKTCNYLAGTYAHNNDPYDKYDGQYVRPLLAQANDASTHMRVCAHGCGHQHTESHTFSNGECTVCHQGQSGFIINIPKDATQSYTTYSSLTDAWNAATMASQAEVTIISGENLSGVTTYTGSFNLPAGKTIHLYPQVQGGFDGLKFNVNGGKLIFGNAYAYNKCEVNINSGKADFRNNKFTNSKIILNGGTANINHGEYTGNTIKINDGEMYIQGASITAADGDYYADASYAVKVGGGSLYIDTEYVEDHSVLSAKNIVIYTTGNNIDNIVLGSYLGSPTLQARYDQYNSNTVTKKSDTSSIGIYAGYATIANMQFSKAVFKCVTPWILSSGTSAAAPLQARNSYITCEGSRLTSSTSDHSITKMTSSYTGTDNYIAAESIPTQYILTYHNDHTWTNTGAVDADHHICSVCGKSVEHSYTTDENLTLKCSDTGCDYSKDQNVIEVVASNGTTKNYTLKDINKLDLLMRNTRDNYQVNVLMDIPGTLTLNDGWHGFDTYKTTLNLGGHHIGKLVMGLHGWNMTGVADIDELQFNAYETLEMESAPQRYNNIECANGEIKKITLNAGLGLNTHVYLNGAVNVGEVKLDAAYVGEFAIKQGGINKFTSTVEGYSIGKLIEQGTYLQKGVSGGHVEYGSTAMSVNEYMYVKTCTNHIVGVKGTYTETTHSGNCAFCGEYQNKEPHILNIVKDTQHKKHTVHCMQCAYSVTSNCADNVADESYCYKNENVDAKYCSVCGQQALTTGHSFKQVSSTDDRHIMQCENCMAEKRGANHNYNTILNSDGKMECQTTGCDHAAAPRFKQGSLNFFYFNQAAAYAQLAQSTVEILNHENIDIDLSSTSGVKLATEEAVFINSITLGTNYTHLSDFIANGHHLYIDRGWQENPENPEELISAGYAEVTEADIVDGKLSSVILLHTPMATMTVNNGEAQICQSYQALCDALGGSINGQYVINIMRDEVTDKKMIIGGNNSVAEGSKVTFNLNGKTITYTLTGVAIDSKSVETIINGEGGTITSTETQSGALTGFNLTVNGGTYSKISTNVNEGESKVKLAPGTKAMLYNQYEKPARYMLPDGCYGADENGNAVLTQATEGDLSAMVTITACQHTSKTSHTAVAANCGTQTDGTIAYDECDLCHFRFNADGDILRSADIPVKWAHNYGADDKCTACGSALPAVVATIVDENGNPVSLGETNGEYSDIATAWTAVTTKCQWNSNTATITINKDITLEAAAFSSGFTGKSLIFDLNGKTLTLSSDDCITTSNGATLELKNGSVIGSINSSNKLLTLDNVKLTPATLNKCTISMKNGAELALTEGYSYKKNSYTTNKELPEGTMEGGCKISGTSATAIQMTQLDDYGYVFGLPSYLSIIKGHGMAEGYAMERVVENGYETSNMQVTYNGSPAATWTLTMPATYSHNFSGNSFVDNGDGYVHACACGEKGTEVVISQDENTYEWSAANFSLTDGSQYNCSIGQFTAQNFSYPRTVTGGSIVTFVLPAAIPVANIHGTVWQYNTYEDGKLKFTEVTEGNTTANMPYVVVLNSNATTLMDANMQNIAMVGSEYPTPEYEGADGNSIMIGTYVKKTVTSDDTYTYYGYSSASGKFVKATSGTLNPFRAMFRIDTSSSSAKAMVDLQLGPDSDDATQVITVDANDLIGTGSAIYTINGQHVTRIYKGQIYIQDGKKIMLK